LAHNDERREGLNPKRIRRSAQIVEVDPDNHDLPGPALGQSFNDRIHHPTSHAGRRIKIKQDGKDGFLNENRDLIFERLKDLSGGRESCFTLTANNRLPEGCPGEIVGRAATEATDFNFIVHFFFYPALVGK